MVSSEIDITERIAYLESDLEREQARLAVARAQLEGIKAELGDGDIATITEGEVTPEKAELVRQQSYLVSDIVSAQMNIVVIGKKLASFRGDVAGQVAVNNTPSEE